MFTLSQTMYLFKANLNLLANTSTPVIAVPLKVEPHGWLPSLLVHWSYQVRNTHARKYSRNLGQSSILARKDTFL